jgi:2-keto-4-pentenoate hydratase/2-oxohepta-3-ene-1,7-dioic acid hydratase in catechol pathway
MVCLARIHHLGQTILAAKLEDGHYCDLSSIAPDAPGFFQLSSETRKQADEMIRKASTNPRDDRRILSRYCKLLAPLNGMHVNKFLGIGMNYVDHCTEQNVPIPKEPMVFSKFGSCIIGTGDPIAKDEHVQKLDYEVELGVVIGKVVPRNTTPQVAKECIGGFTVVHDVSARDWQLEKNGGQWLLGKAGDGYAPIGPVIVTTDELSMEQAHNSGIRCRVNGETLQDSNTSNLVHKVDDVIAFLSKFMTLYPGDIIATGTPPGVGCFRKPPRWLVPGDVVECEIDGIGTIVNPIVDRTTSSSTSVASLPFVAAGNGRLLGMSCIVTGGARGIGYGIAARFGREGASHVTIIDLDQESIDRACINLQEVASSCSFQGKACDVTNMDQVTKTWADVAGWSSNKIDVLVQAAGIVGATGRKAEDVDPANFDAVYQVNVRGIFNGCVAVLPYMKRQNYGRIVNIASIAGKEGNAGMCCRSILYHNDGSLVHS